MNKGKKCKFHLTSDKPGMQLESVAFYSAITEILINKAHCRSAAALTFKVISQSITYS